MASRRSSQMRRRHVGARRVEAAGHQLGQGHAQRGRATVHVSRQGARLRGRVARHRPHQPGVLQGARSQDRLPQRERHRALHRGRRGAIRARRGRGSTTGRRATRATCSTCSRATSANITLLSPIHYDYYAQTITAEEYNEPIELALERYGKPPFGTCCTANPNPSTLVNFGRTAGSTCTRAAMCASTTPTGT